MQHKKEKVSEKKSKKQKTKGKKPNYNSSPLFIDQKDI